MPAPTARGWLALLLAAFAAVATAYNVVVPVFEAPDEHLHYLVADHVARTGALPVQTRDPEARGPWEQEGSQPPLYYVLAAPIVRATGGWLDPDDLRINDRNSMGSPAVLGNENRFVHDPAVEGWPWRGWSLGAHAVRALSTLLGAAALAAIFGLARRAFAGPERDALALAATALVAFNPQWLAMSASVTNDVLVAALAAVALWLLARILDGACTWPALLSLALAVGLAPLAKLSGLALAAFAAATLAWDGWRARALRIAAGRIALLGTSAALLSGWWYARNVRLYGSLTGLDHMLIEGVGRDANLERFLRGLPAELGGLWRSSWGIFGWFTVPLPEAAFAVLALASLIGLAGAAAALARRAPWLRAGRAGWLGLWWLILFASLLRWLMLVKGAHGRLLFPAVAAPAVLLVAGWQHWAGARVPRGRAAPAAPGAAGAAGDVGDPERGVDATVGRRDPGAAALAAATAGAMVALATWALLGVVRPAFAAPERIAEADIPADATRVDAVFDGRLRLVAHEIPRRATGGAPMPVTLYWQVTAPIARDVFVGLAVHQWLGIVDAPGAYRDDGRPATTLPAPGEAVLAYPGAGALPFDLVTPGPDVIVDRRRIVAPPPATSRTLDLDDAFDRAIARAGHVAGLPQLGRLAIHVWDPAAGASWPVAAADGTATAGNAVYAELALQAADRPAIAAGAPIARFDDALTLAWPEGREAPRAAVDGAAARVSVVAPRLRASGAVSPALEVVWRAERDPNVEAQLFVHLVDAAGAIVAQFDAPPVAYAVYPTGLWREGDVLPGRVAFDVPAAARPDERYRLVVGLYRLVEGAPRLTAVGADGARLPDDAVVLAEVEVVGKEEP